MQPWRMEFRWCIYIYINVYTYIYISLKIYKYTDIYIYMLNPQVPCPFPVTSHRLHVQGTFWPADPKGWARAVPWRGIQSFRIGSGARYVRARWWLAHRSQGGDRSQVPWHLPHLELETQAGPYGISVVNQKMPSNTRGGAIGWWTSSLHWINCPKRPTGHTYTPCCLERLWSVSST